MIQLDRQGKNYLSRSSFGLACSPLLSCFDLATLLQQNACMK